jgi:hypothetical protein
MHIIEKLSWCSTKGLGKMAPDMANSKITDDGVVVPLGKPKKVSPGKVSFKKSNL